MPDSSTGNAAFWMRPISFKNIVRVLHLVSERPSPLTAKDLDDLVRTTAAVTTHGGTPPSRTTLYHYRNTMLRLGLLVRNGRTVAIQGREKHVRELLARPFHPDRSLDSQARELLAELVIQQHDCRSVFFDLFMNGVADYRLADFRNTGGSVIWLRPQTGDMATTVLLRNERNGEHRDLCSASQIKSVLYGVRYWARDELGLIDEFFQEGRGAIMYPLSTSRHTSVETIISDITERIEDKSDQWTTLAITNMLVDCCERKHRPVSLLHHAISKLYKDHPGRVLLVPTSSSLATLTASSKQREAFILRSYYQDQFARYVSHLRMHNSLKERLYAH